jgi:hypothetical protein
MLIQVIRCARECRRRWKQPGSVKRRPPSASERGRSVERWRYDLLHGK